MRHEKKIQDLELKIDNHQWAQHDQLTYEIASLKAKNQALVSILKKASHQSNRKCKSLINYFHAAITSLILEPPIRPEFEESLSDVEASVTPGPFET